VFRFPINDVTLPGGFRVLPGGCEALPEGPPNNDILARGGICLPHKLCRGLKLSKGKAASWVVSGVGRQKPDCNGQSNLFWRQK
jgi:hypothetical protein